MSNYVPKTTGEENFELYNVVYSVSDEEGLKDYFKNRNHLTWTPYIKVETEDEYYFTQLPKIEGKITEIEWIKNFKNNYKSDIYSFILDKTFTLIIFNSRDVDSVLTKDIIIKQYQSVYGRNIEDWKKDGVIIYDIAKDRTLYPTIDGKYYFNFCSLQDNSIDEIFLCGYDVDSNVIKQFVKSNEKVFIFENNPLKINLIKSFSRNSNNMHYCMTNSQIKAYQAYTLFRDPIGNIKTNDNKALEILKDYSDMITISFKTCEEWQRLEKIKIWFERKVEDNEWRGKFINCLFGENEYLMYEEAELENAKDSDAFSEDLKHFSNQWTDNTIAINTRAIPSYNQVNKLISTKKEYNKIVIFFKSDAGYWSLMVFKVDRKLENGISIDKADSIDPITKIQNKWYTEQGIPVIKVDNLYEVLWYNMIGKNPIPANYYELDLDNGNYIFDTKNRKYMKFVWNDEASSNRYPLVNNKKINNAYKINDVYQTYRLIEDNKHIVFDTVYKTKDDIEFNQMNLFEKLKNKYYCRGNKYFVNCSLTDKQIYDCLKAKSILG